MLKIVVNKISDPKCFIVSVYMVEKHMVSESGGEKKTWCTTQAIQTMN